MSTKRKKIWKRLFMGLIILPVVIISALIGIIYAKQDSIVQTLLKTINADFKGEVIIEDSHISPFANFPYISIDLDNLKLYEDKSRKGTPIIDVQDLYLGFDIITLIKGNMDINLIKIKNGKINIVQSANGEMNIINAFTSDKPVENTEEEFHLNLKSVQLENVDITKKNLENLMTIELFVNKAKSKFKSSAEHMLVSLDSKFVMNLIQDKDTTFFKHKHVVFKTELDYKKKEDKLTIVPSSFDIEHAEFDFEGSIDMKNNAYLDMIIKGSKPNFDIFMALAPEELAPVLKKYNNRGKILFTAELKGSVAEGKLPKVIVNFACENAYLHNTETDKKLDELNFKAFFTTGDSGKPETMEFRLTDFSSRPEAGIFSGHLLVKNFAEPEIDTKIVSDFDLEFLSKFVGVKDLQNLKGKIKLTMNFKDIIDLNHPEKAIEKLNESYFTELQVTNLSFKSKDYHLPIDQVNINAVMEGHEAKIKQFEVKIGKSDISLTGSISDLPAIIHHTRDKVTAILDIKSKYLDIKELTADPKTKKTGVDEQIQNLNMKFTFKSSAKAFTESPNLPVGEFFIDDMYAKMKHYPHTIHDFHADMFIDTSDFRIIDFTGMIDKSDFHFNGRLKNYNLWFMETAKGDTKMEFDLTSRLLQLEDVFSYKGDNYVPEDYRHEELRDLKLHGHVDMHFIKELKSIDLYLDQFSTKMKMHKYKFEKFKGRVHYEDDHLMVKDFYGKLGKSSFEIDLNYYLGKDKNIKKRDNHFGIVSTYLDFDELFAFNPSPNTKTVTPADHEAGFNIYELPFTDMTIDLDIAHLNYHRYLIHNIKSKMRTTENHYLYIDTLAFLAADGKFNMRGYFNGSDKNKIYLSPVLKMDKVDLDKLLFKFENFGQDHMVSENVHGRLSGKITGKLRMHRDMVPIIDDSELHMDIEVTDGKLEKYAPLTAMADYFKDKNVAKVLFDTLRNHIDMNKGTMSFPLMTINSSLGFIEVSGKQDMNFNMEYFIKVPMKLVTGVARQKLFGGGKNEEIDPEQEDEIQYKDATKKIRYVNLKLSGNSENFKIGLVKDKEIKKGH